MGSLSFPYGLRTLRKSERITLDPADPEPREIFTRSIPTKDQRAERCGLRAGVPRYSLEATLEVLFPEAPEPIAIRPVLRYWAGWIQGTRQPFEAPLTVPLLNAMVIDGVTEFESNILGRGWSQAQILAGFITSPDQGAPLTSGGYGSANLLGVNWHNQANPKLSPYDDEAPYESWNWSSTCAIALIDQQALAAGPQPVAATLNIREYIEYAMYAPDFSERIAECCGVTAFNFTGCG